MINEKARKYACDLHSLRNLKYGEGEYSIHLELVRSAAYRYLYLIPEKWRDVVLATAWLHDTLEDCAITYNDLNTRFGYEVAENVRALTNDPRGRNRKERAESSYPLIKANKYANYIKICDRIANTKFSKESGSSMYKKYSSEFEDFKNNIYVEDYGYEEMWNELKKI
jgi:(p)ppGpp synthase/HD superfamily hydrolase